MDVHTQNTDMPIAIIRNSPAVQTDEVRTGYDQSKRAKSVAKNTTVATEWDSTNGHQIQEN